MLQFKCQVCGGRIINVVDGIPGDGKRCLICMFLDDVEQAYGPEMADEFRRVAGTEQALTDDDIRVLPL